MKKLGASMFKSGNFKNNDVMPSAPKKSSKLTALTKKKEDDILIDDIDDLDENTVKDIFVNEGLMKNKNKDRIKNNMFAGIECENSLYVFSKQNWLRQKMYILFKHKAFDNIIMGLIVLSSLKLASDTYYMDADPNSTSMTIS